MKQKPTRYDVNDVDDHIREALEKPLEIRERPKLPKLTPVENLDRCPLKPAPTNVRRRVPR
jgi:hypothetical protein